MRHFMIDVETIGLQNNAGIWQIGICELFNAALQAEFTCNPDSCQEEGSHKFSYDQNTTDWQEKDNKANWDKAHTLGIQSGAHSRMIQELVQWIKDLNLQSHDFKIWAKGPQFDIVKLEYHFAVYGIKCPWKYSQVMDFRTIEYLSGKRCTVPKSQAHGGLADAIFQAKFFEEFLEYFYVQTGRKLYEECFNFD